MKLWNIVITFLFVIGSIIFAVWLLFGKEKQAVNLAESEGNVPEVLLRLAWAQENFQTSCTKDTDKDQIGEYGPIENFVGYSNDRFGVFPPFSTHKKQGFIAYLNYNYCIYLPKNIDSQERHWVCYAWPSFKIFRMKPTKAFVINEQGVIYYCPAHNYVGNKIPSPYAAFVTTDDEGDDNKWIIASSEKQQISNDNERWEKGQSIVKNVKDAKKQH